MYLTTRVLFVLMAITQSFCLNGLQIKQNQIYDLSGNKVVLRGVDRSGTEFACVKGDGIFDGPNDQGSIDAMKTWHINAVRIPLNEDCWLGINGVNPAYSGSNYINAVQSFVDLFVQNEIYVIIDLHWSAPGSTLATTQTPMPNIDHSSDFWSSVGSVFKSNPNVIFDLFNEPYPDNGADSDDAWNCWKTGACNGLGYQAIGMQGLINAVRNSGANNIVMLGGLTWSNALSQWLTYLPSDPVNQIACSWHTYNFNGCNNQACWDQHLAPIAAKYPVIAGEMGENDCQSGYIDSLMPYLDSHGISYLGWTWNTWDCGSGPSLISDYNGTPTGFGQGYKDHLASFVANQTAA